MLTDSRAQHLARRIAGLYAHDPQYAAAAPNKAITAAAEQPGLSLPQIIGLIMEGYADRPALGQRATALVTDPDTGRTTSQLQPEFETITYRELTDRAHALANALAATPAIEPGDRAGVLGFTSVDYTIIDLALVQLGAVSVPLQTSATPSQLQPIVAETEPKLIAASIDALGDAVELALTSHLPARLVVFDYLPEVDEQREAVEAARTRLADSGVIVEPLADLIDRGTTLPPANRHVDPTEDPLALLIYTSGSTGPPRARCTSRAR